MERLKPLYQQVSQRLLIFITLNLLIIAILGVFLFQHFQQTRYVEQALVPQFTQSLAVQADVYRAKQLLSKLVIADEATNYLQDLQSYHKLLVTFDNLAQQVKLTSEISTALTTAEQLSANHQRNEQLRENALLQLTLVNEALAEQFQTDPISEQGLLINSVQQFAQAFTHFNSLTIRTSLAQFSSDVDALEKVVEQWRPIIAKNDQRFNDNVKETVAELDNLLWQQQRMIAKWRSQIRLANEIKVMLTRHIAVLDDYLVLLGRGQLKQSTEFNGSVLTRLVNKIEKFGPYSIAASLLTISLLLLGLLMWFAYRIVAHVKVNGQQTVTFLKQLDNDDHEFNVNSYEQQFIQQTFNKLKTFAAQLSQIEPLKQSLAEVLSVAHSHSDITIWQYPAADDAMIRDIKTSLGLTVNQAWYHAFERSEVTKIIELAKAARELGVSQQGKTQNKQQRTFYLTVEFNQGKWQGTLSERRWQTELELDFSQQLSELQRNTQQDRLIQLEYSQAMSKKLIRTLLQCHHYRNVNERQISHLYRHLVKAYQWSQQQQLAMMLANTERQVKLVDVSFFEELKSLLHNIRVDAKLQHNQVYYSLDRRLIEDCKINVRLFHQTLSDVCFLLLNEPLHATLIIDVSLLDKDAGQQVLKFSFDVSSQEHLRKSAVLEALIGDHEGPSEAAEHADKSQLSYFKRLLKITHGHDLQCKDIEQGYQLSFSMPITIEKIVNSGHQDVDLSQSTLIMLSKDAKACDWLKGVCKRSGAHYLHTGSLQYLHKQLSLKILSKQPIDAVIVYEDAFDLHMGEVYQHLQTLPEKVRPKLLAIQPFSGQNFAQTGLYYHSRENFYSQNFAQQLKQFIKGKEQVNMALDATFFAQYHFDFSPVEVLLAVENTASHQLLIRLLEWLGLQVHIATNEWLCEKLWKSGRYTIAISELADTALVEPEVGKRIKRTIYALSESSLANFQDNQSAYRQSWQIEKLPKILDLPAIIRTFSPWLNEQHQQMRHQVGERKLTKKVVIDSSAPIEQSKSSDTVFDLAKYAFNQGSAELAALMAEDYCQELDEQVDKIIELCHGEHFDEAANVLTAIIKIAKIMAAQDVLKSSQQIELLLKQQSYRDIGDALNVLKEQQQRLTEYVEAI
ncbi:hypothetical protein [Thalassotalea ganghwensis]